MDFGIMWLRADAPRGYRDFDKGAAAKIILDTHGLLSA
jgi:hypothetical protein